jgi:Uma2 family endonuclease
MAVTEPIWEIAELFPEQGSWTETEYMRLPGNRLVEFCEGKVELLPMPSQRHQEIVGLLYMLLFSFVTTYRLGKVLIAPFKIRLWSGKIREPDIMFMFSTHSHKRLEQYWQGADLVIEVVSPDDPERDTVIKKDEYAKAGISEYWLVNPTSETVTVFMLVEGLLSYKQAGIYSRSQIAESVLLKGFLVEVNQVFL